MAYYDFAWYLNSVGHAAVTVRPQNAAVAVGAIRKQFTAPAVGSERCFICIIAGTTANVTDATWVLTRGAKTVDGTVTWMECTGQASLNSDGTNTPTWAQFKASAVGNPSLGVIIKRNDGASYQICTTTGTLGATEPAFSNTAGTTTTETAGTAVWTSLGVVGNYTTKGAAPFARLVAACATNWFAAGNTLYVGNNHSEQQGSALTAAPSGSSATVSKILCHDPAGSYPPAAGDLETGALISTAAFNISLTPAGGQGWFYIYGLTFRSGVGSSSSNSVSITTSAGTIVHFERCLLELASSHASSTIALGVSAAGAIVLSNTQVKFAATTQDVTLNCGSFLWRNTGQVLASGSLIPADFLAMGSVYCDAVLEGLDLSQLTGALFASIAPAGRMLIKDCKLHPSMTIMTPSVSGFPVQLVRSSA